MTGQITPWKPFGTLTSLRRDMDRLWERFFGEDLGLTDWGNGWFPSLDLSETNDEILVRTELAGVDPKDVDISISGDVLNIKGEKKEEKEKGNVDYHLMERQYGAFSRSVRLPAEVKEEKIEAKYKNGVLQIILPKADHAKRKAIEIKVA